MFVFIRDVIVEKMFKSSKRYMIGGLGLAYSEECPNNKCDWNALEKLILRVLLGTKALTDGLTDG